MNKLTFFHILILLVLALHAKTQDRLTVVASTTIFEDMVKEIGGDKFVTKSIVPIGGDPHIYEPKPSDVVLVASADLILVNGLNFEGWIMELIRNSGTKATIVTITKGIEPIQSEQYKNAFDPHAWMDASLGQIYIQNIANALMTIDPDNHHYYSERLDRYKAELSKTDDFILQAIAEIPENRRILITSHDAFAYYGKRYGLEVSPLMGISTDSEAQTSDMVRVVNQIKERNIPAIFIESTINPKLMEQIARDNKVIIGGELFSDSIGDAHSGADSYLKMLTQNTNIIHKALTTGVGTATKIDRDDRSSSWIVYAVMALIMAVVMMYMFKKTIR